MRRRFRSLVSPNANASDPLELSLLRWVCHKQQFAFYRFGDLPDLCKPCPLSGHRRLNGLEPYYLWARYGIQLGMKYGTVSFIVLYQRRHNDGLSRRELILL